jgi:integrase
VPVHYLDEVTPAEPGAAAEAEKVRTRLLHEVDEGRNPKTPATANQMLDRYLETLDVEPTTRARHEGSSATTCDRRSGRCR